MRGGSERRVKEIRKDVGEAIRGRGNVKKCKEGNDRWGIKEEKTRWKINTAEGRAGKSPRNVRTTTHPTISCKSILKYAESPDM